MTEKSRAIQETGQSSEQSVENGVINLKFSVKTYFFYLGWWVKIILVKEENAIVVIQYFLSKHQTVKIFSVKPAENNASFQIIRLSPKGNI